MPVKALAAGMALFLCVTAASGSENIRVALADNRRTVAIASESGLVMGGRTDAGSEKKVVLSPDSVGSRPLRIRARSGLVRMNGKRYRGWLEVRKKRNGLLLIINDLDIEDYLQGVVTSEIPHGWEYEALKAQAVAARTYALYQKRTAGSRSYHILATVSSQVYDGGNGERPRGAKAVRETKGLVLMYRGEIIPAFYHSSCGGHTEDAAELWGIDEPYLKGVDCECQEISQYGLWEKRIGKQKVIAALRRQGIRVSDITGMGIRGITTAGRVKEVSVRSSQGERFIPADALRAALGNTTIPSVFFELEMEGDEAIFSGRGAGHGVGLCQWGAEEMAEQGYDFRSILSHYYPGTNIVQME
jgi:stage II sporulation protein D